MVRTFLSFQRAALAHRCRRRLRGARSGLRVARKLLATLNGLSTVVSVLHGTPSNAATGRRFRQRFALDRQRSSTVLTVPLHGLANVRHRKLRTRFRRLARQHSRLRHLLSSHGRLLGTLGGRLGTLHGGFGSPHHAHVRDSRRQTRRARRIRRVVTRIRRRRTIIRFARGNCMHHCSRHSCRQQRTQLRPSASPGLRPARSSLAVRVRPTLSARRILDLAHSNHTFAIKIRTVPDGPHRNGNIPLIGLLPSSIPTSTSTIITRFILHRRLLSCSLVLIDRGNGIGHTPLGRFAGLANHNLATVGIGSSSALTCIALTRTKSSLILNASNNQLLHFPVSSSGLAVVKQTTRNPRNVHLNGCRRLVNYIAIRSNCSRILLVSTTNCNGQLPMRSLHATEQNSVNARSFRFDLGASGLITLLPTPTRDALALFSGDSHITVVPATAIPHLNHAKRYPHLIGPGGSRALIQIARIIPIGGPRPTPRRR